MANNMMRWDPFREMVSLRDAMDSLFENALIGPRGGEGGVSTVQLPLDIVEEDDNYIVRASLPGLKPEDVNVTVVDNVLTIEGEAKGEEQKEGSRWHLRERRWGQFSRQIALPTTIDANNVQAEYSDGVLKLTLPKAEEAKPKRIAIRANGQQQKTLEGTARHS